jgi:hypothetical protein
MELKVKTGNEATFSIEIEETQTVLELKQAISTHYSGETTPVDQRLIFTGKVLKDELLLSEYKLKEGNT